MSNLKVQFRRKFPERIFKRMFSRTENNLDVHLEDAVHIAIEFKKKKEERLDFCLSKIL